MNALAQRVIPDAEPDRKRYLGGSDIAAIMGVGAYGRTPLTCYLSKTGDELEPMDPEKKRFLNRRKRWEGPIIEMLREEFDAEIVSVNKRYVDTEYDFMAAEIDFEWRDQDGTIQNGEIKTVSPFNFGELQGWGEAGTDEIPVHYAAQTMYGLGIMRRRVCIVAAMVGLDSMVFYRIERDDETITAMRERAVHFWREHVLKRVPPDPVSLADVMKLTLKIAGKPVELDEATLAGIKKLHQIRDSHKAMDAEEEEIGFQVFEFVRQQWKSSALSPDELPTDNAVLNFGGRKVATWNRQRGANLDQKRLKLEQPEIVAAFTKEYFYRVLRLAKPK